MLLHLFERHPVAPVRKVIGGMVVRRRCSDRYLIVVRAVAGEVVHRVVASPVHRETVAAGVGSRGSSWFPPGSSRNKLPQRYRGGRGLQVGSTKQGDQFQQTRHRAPRFVALSHLATSIEIGHPRGNEHTTILCLKFELPNIASPELPSNRQIVTVERVKRVVNRGVARITGIFVE